MELTREVICWIPFGTVFSAVGQCIARSCRRWTWMTKIQMINRSHLPLGKATSVVSARLKLQKKMGVSLQLSVFLLD